MFVGQRKEGFAVNVGTIVDLVNAKAETIIDAANRGAVPCGATCRTLALDSRRSCRRRNKKLG